MQASTENLPTLAPDASIATRLRLAAHSLNVLKDDPAHTHYGPLLNACLDSETYAALAKKWRTTEEGRAFLDERPTLQGADLDLLALENMPAGTLGYEFIQYFRKNNISPFVTAFPINNDVDFLSKRYRETHDIFHLLTGYGTDVIGEMELQAFVMGNLKMRQTWMILAFGCFEVLKMNGIKGYTNYLSRLRAAYERGARSREMLSVRYENMWSKPVTEIAQNLCAA